MISKNLLFKLQKEDIKRRIWALALISLIFTLILPIRSALMAENYSEQYDSSKFFVNFMGVNNTYVFVFTIAFALICGLSSFFYLHSRKKVDLYHSIPVKREALFSINFINGILIYAVPYILSILVCFLILQLKGYMKGEVFSAACTAAAINLLFYCFIYVVTILAVMLTGNIIVSCLGTAVFLFYGPLILALKNIYFHGFFNTYYTPSNEGGSYYLLSPLYTYYEVLDRSSTGEKYGSLIVYAAVLIVVFICLSVLLYKKRPSEAAGKAMSFGISKPIIKFLLVIPAALSGGMVLRNIVSANYDGWFIFGILFTLIVAYAIIQIIYHFDVRSALKQKRQLLICFLVTMVIAGFFRFDILQWDSYLPDKDDVKEMSVYISGIDEQIIGNDYTLRGYGYVDRAEYHLANMKLTDLSAAYEIAKLGVESDNKNDQYLYAYREGYYTYIVKYSLKGGKTAYRQYCIEVDKSLDLLKSVYENPEYKRAHYPINQVDINKIEEIDVAYADDILNYTLSGSYGNGNINISNKTNAKDIKELTQIYLEELNQLALEDLRANPVAVLNFRIADYTMGSCYVYPTFTNTIAALNRLGFDTTKTIDLSKVKGIRVMAYPDDMYYFSGKEAIQGAEENQVVTYTDPAKISEICAVVTNYRVNSDQPVISQIEDKIEVSIQYDTGDNSMGQDFYYCFQSGRIPDFVSEDLKLTKE